MVKDIFDKALEEVYGLSDGTRKWTMCVPAESTDSDVLLCDALRFGKELLECVRALRHNERIVDDSGMMDNYVDAARSRGEIVKLQKQLDELSQKAVRFDKKG